MVFPNSNVENGGKFRGAVRGNSQRKKYQLVGYVCSVSFSSTTSLALRLVRPRNSVEANV